MYSMHGVPKGVLWTLMQQSLPMAHDGFSSVSQRISELSACLRARICFDAYLIIGVHTGAEHIGRHGRAQGAGGQQ